MINKCIAIAPMMGYTNRHFRYFIRLLSQKILLYTEMITTQALLRSNPARFLSYHASEHPLALQLGGSDPTQLASCAKLAADWGYDEINLNVGCPSNRVQAGQFGACLMLQPELVAECVATLCASVKLPITVKTRLGVDQHDSYEHLHHLISCVSQAGAAAVIIHARKAWLKGLNPKQNRSVPALDYERVYAIKRDFPKLKIIINGGIGSIADIEQHFIHVDGVMIGRAAYQNPYLLAQLDQLFFASPHPILSREAVIEQFMPYLKQQCASGIPSSTITRNLVGLYHGQSGAKCWRGDLHCLG